MSSTHSPRVLAPRWFGGRTALPERVRAFVQDALADFPWRVEFRDWRGGRYAAGGDEPHWSGRALRVELRSEAAARDLLRLDAMRFLERFLDGEVDMSGNLYAMASIRRRTHFDLKPRQALAAALRFAAFQSVPRARVSVKSHYDIPQEAIDLYLDRVYQSYSCGIFEDPDRLDLAELTRAGRGRDDAFDSLEKAMWRKFEDAVAYVAPREGETLLDVGCGYGGQLAVALEGHPFGKVVGWTHSSNQAREGARRLAVFGRERWELNEGDYREDTRVFDHVTSTGMVSHVGPRGLVPYVRNVRRRIRTGGRYLHHALMIAHSGVPLDFQVGIAFNKRYVWPGFHWFTLGQHVRALERNGFQVERATNLTRHYAKTTASWYERMMGRRARMVELLGEPTTRAWQVFLAGITGSYLEKDIHVYRLYCQAV